MRCLAATVAMLCLVVARTEGQQPTFKTGVNTVSAYVTVTMRGDRHDTRLTAADFEVRDDVGPRTVTQFDLGLRSITAVVLVDASASVDTSTPSPVAAAADFVETLRPDDRAAVGQFDRTIHLDGALTNDRAELRRRLGEPRPRTAGTVLWDAMDAAMSTLAAEAGRKVVIVLTDGDDTSSNVTAADVVARASRDEMMVYVLAIRGAENRVNPVLAHLARETGGGYLEIGRGGDLSAALQQVADELHHQYLIGFTVEKLDGRTHRLDVRVKTPGAIARARRSYVAAPAK